MSGRPRPRPALRPLLCCCCCGRRGSGAVLGLGGASERAGGGFLRRRRRREGKEKAARRQAALGRRVEGRPGGAALGRRSGPRAPRGTAPSGHGALGEAQGLGSVPEAALPTCPRAWGRRALSFLLFRCRFRVRAGEARGAAARGDPPYSPPRGRGAQGAEDFLEEFGLVGPGVLGGRGGYVL